MKTLEILRYTPASDDGHPAILVVKLRVDQDVVLEGEQAEKVKARIEAQEAGK